MSISYIVIQDGWRKLTINVSNNNHIILFFYEDFFYIRIPVKMKLLSISPATNILIIQPWGKT